jgi:hypothetical protein
MQSGASGFVGSATEMQYGVDSFAIAQTWNRTR